MSTSTNSIKWTQNSSSTYLQPTPPDPITTPSKVAVGANFSEVHVSYTPNQATYTATVGPKSVGTSYSTPDTGYYARVDRTGVRSGVVHRTDCVIL